MNIDLSQIEPGFTDPSLGSQSVFRRCLDALAHPGSPVEVQSDARAPEGLEPATNALLLALLDQDTGLWLSPELRRTSVPAHLRFHTGCALVAEAATADFAVLDDGEANSALASFHTGTESYPDRSATLVVQVAALREGGGWTLSGPGISGRRRLEVGGLGPEFVAQWAANRNLFPCGVDLYLACGNRLVGLPRTTRIEEARCT